MKKPHLGPSQRLKKLTALSAACTKLPNAFNPFGTIRKQFLLCKNTKKARYVRSLGTKPHLGHSQRLKKGVFIYAICLCRLRTLPKIMQIPRLSEKKVYCVESCDFVDKVEKTPFWAFPEHKKLTGALSCVHKAPKCIQSLWDHPKQFLLCKNTKKARYVRSLGKKPHLGHSQRLKKVLLSTQSVCARLRTLPIIMQIPRGYQKKKFIV